MLSGGGVASIRQDGHLGFARPTLIRQPTIILVLSNSG